MSITVRPLHVEDDRSSFRSGNVELDRFFQRYAGQNQFRHHIGTTYVAVEGDEIVGFATVVASQIEISRFPAECRACQTFIGSFGRKTPGRIFEADPSTYLLGEVSQESRSRRSSHEDDRIGQASAGGVGHATRPRHQDAEA